MPDRSLRPRAGSSAKALLLTVLGELVLPHGGTVWTATLVDALELLGVNEPNARQAAARLKEQGLLDTERHGRHARWRLTAAGRHLLTAGTERIYRFGSGRPRGTVAGSWCCPPFRRTSGPGACNCEASCRSPGSASSMPARQCHRTPIARTSPIRCCATSTSSILDRAARRVGLAGRR